MAQYRIGISGWRYPPWRGTFFPPDLTQKDELAYASRQVNSIEINGTFYSLQRPTSFRAWHDQTPDDFVFSVKCPRYITHIRRLKEIETPLANFFASGVLSLGDKLGPLLWQFPPSFTFEPTRLGEFFKLLPRDTAAAARLARRHDTYISSASLKPAADRPLRHAMEVRHDSFKTPEFLSLLREHQIAVVVADTAGRWPLFEDVTSDFIYVRLHGDEELYVSGYTRAALQQWSRKLRTWHRGANSPAARRLLAPAKVPSRGRDVFVYFDNDVKIQAPYDAMTLAHRLGVGPRPDTAPDATTVKEEPRQSADWLQWRRRGTQPPISPRKAAATSRRAA